MLFRNLLDQKTKQLESDFDKLLLDVLNSQTHSGDLFLVLENAFYYPKAKNWTNVPESGRSPYMVGPGDEGHSENLHHQFISDYLDKNIETIALEEYQSLHKFSPERKQEIENLTRAEAYSIQLEMLIYIKIWESDLFIKKLYQITRLIEKLEYDWHFSIKEGNRSNEDHTGKRHEIIRKKIRDKLKDRYPEIYAAMKNAYKSQVRNSIAHSKYSFLGRFIHLNNKTEEDGDFQIGAVLFNEWIEMIHNTIAIASMVNRLFIRADQFYETYAAKNAGKIEIRINKKDPKQETTYVLYEYRRWGK